MRYAWVVPQSRSMVMVSCSKCRADHPIFTRPVRAAARALLELLEHEADLAATPIRETQLPNLDRSSYAIRTPA
jgi:hypothetical protein